MQDGQGCGTQPRSGYPERATQRRQRATGAPRTRTGINPVAADVTLAPTTCGRVSAYSMPWSARSMAAAAGALEASNMWE